MDELWSVWRNLASETKNDMIKMLFQTITKTMVTHAFLVWGSKLQHLATTSSFKSYYASRGNRAAITHLRPPQPKR